jgi:hypothetical protein
MVLVNTFVFRSLDLTAVTYSGISYPQAAPAMWRRVSVPLSAVLAQHLGAPYPINDLAVLAFRS